MSPWSWATGRAAGARAGAAPRYGRIDDRYPLVETGSPGYLERTRRNVRDSDGTLILLRGAPEGGTRMTADHAGKLDRPLFIVDFDRAARIGEVRRWLRAHGIATLNVAGPRGQQAAGDL